MRGEGEVSFCKEATLPSSERDKRRKTDCSRLKWNDIIGEQTVLFGYKAREQGFFKMETANERPYITVVLTKLKAEELCEEHFFVFRSIQIANHSSSSIFIIQLLSLKRSDWNRATCSQIEIHRLRSSRIIKSLVIENEMYKTWAVLIGLTVTNISWWTALYGRRWPPLIPPQASVVDRAWRSSRAKQTISFTIICGSKATLLLCSKHSAKPRRHNTVAKKNIFKITPSS